MVMIKVATNQNQFVLRCREGRTLVKRKALADEMKYIPLIAGGEP